MEEEEGGGHKGDSRGNIRGGGEKDIKREKEGGREGREGREEGPLEVVILLGFFSSKNNTSYRENHEKNFAILKMSFAWYC